jgi:D-inositol-3-phosphate glycosyltransferase
MRIAMVSEHASPLAALGGVDAGGQNVHVAELSRALVKRGHEVTVFTRLDDPDLPLRVETVHGYVVEHVPAGPATDIPKDSLLPYMQQFGEHLAKRSTEEPFELVHAHFWMSGLAAVVAGQRTGLPVVQTFHALGTVKRRYQGAKDTSPRQRISLEKVLCRTVDRIIATCSDEVRELLPMGAAVRQISVVPCGVDTAHFTPGPRRRTNSAAPFRIVVAGRLVERKGVDDAIRALVYVPQAELLIAGGPPARHLDGDPEYHRLQDVARASGVLGRVRFLGRVEHAEMPKLLQSADVVITVPWYEPFGIVPLEAMACGRPVIAAAVGGLADTVVDGVTGILVPPRDPQALAAALRALATDQIRCEGYGMAGRQRVLARYTWDRVAAETEAAYERVHVQRSAGTAEVLT